MIIEIRRRWSDHGATLGELFVDNDKFGWTLENEKTIAETAGIKKIPEGRYVIRLRKEGPMHKKYAGRYPYVHRGMLEIQNIPEMTYVYPHIGNIVTETSGCPLIGLDFTHTNHQIAVNSSVVGYVKMYQAVIESAEAKQLVIIIADHK